MSHGAAHDVSTRLEAAITAALGRRSVVLVGMMGSGKSSIGRRVALRLGIPFVDADAEIEKAAGMSISDIFAIRGGGEFRAGETIIVDAEPNPDNPLEMQIAFRTLEGFEPPAMELAGAFQMELLGALNP